MSIIRVSYQGKPHEYVRNMSHDSEKWGMEKHTFVGKHKVTR